MMQLTAAEVVLAAQIELCFHAGEAEGKIDEPFTPWAAEGVGDEHRNVDGGTLQEGGAQSPRGGVGVFGE